MVSGLHLCKKRITYSSYCQKGKVRRKDFHQNHGLEMSRKRNQRPFPKVSLFFPRDLTDSSAVLQDAFPGQNFQSQVPAPMAGLKMGWIYPSIGSC